jgi:hypothetical protein
MTAAWWHAPDSVRSVIEWCAEAFERRAVSPQFAAAVPEALAEQVNRSDHRGCYEVDYPALMVIDTAPLRSPHDHPPTDTPERLDYGTMARVVAAMQWSSRTWRTRCRHSVCGARCADATTARRA